MSSSTAASAASLSTDERRADADFSESDPRPGSVLAYVGFWISGLLMLCLSHDPRVRFHAKQSILVFGAVHLLWAGLDLLPFRLAFFSGALLLVLTLGLWLYLLKHASNGLRLSLPFAGDLARTPALRGTAALV